MSVAASASALSHVTDLAPGITRQRAGKGFRYLRPDGKRIRDPAIIDRINHLAIPPAWRAVWICPSAQGHVQATGRDAKGRKQHRYHADFRAWREREKYDHLRAFGRALPKLRARIERDRRKKGLPREKVLATIVHLLDTSLIRVGNSEYAEANKSYGLTTLLDRHVSISGESVQFVFTGKSGKLWKVRMKSGRIAKVLRAMQDLPGQHLCQYLDEDGHAQQVGSGDVNQYLRDITQQDISAKDFRTWAGTVLAGAALADLPAPKSETAAKRAEHAVVVDVAKRLGNTPAICRKCYIHPVLLERFKNGTLAKAVKHGASRRWLSHEETRILALLEGPRHGRRKPGAKAPPARRRKAAPRTKTKAAQRR